MVGDLNLNKEERDRRWESKARPIEMYLADLVRSLDPRYSAEGRQSQKKR